MDTRRSTIARYVFAFLLLTMANSYAEDMRAAKAGNEWRSHMEAAAAAGVRLVSESGRRDPQSVQELYRQYMSGMAMAYMGLFLGDPEYPDFWPQVGQAFNFLAPNPDDTYYLAPLEGKGVYRLSGFRGTVHMVDAQIGSGEMMPHGTGSLGPNFATHDLDQLHIGSDGSFEVILSVQRPAGYAGDWWPIGENVSYLLIRQVAYDWIREVDGRYAIERLDRPAPRPPMSASQIAQNLRTIPLWAENWTRMGMKWVAGYQAKGLVNKLQLIDLTKVGGVASQQYIEGQYDIGPDEALIYETEIPEQCRYWNIQLADMLWTALDFTNRQTSLNGHSASLDSDGRFRAVISATDPGVPNWLDTSGHQTGTLVGRWTECSSYPTPQLTRVKLADLHRHLPADTPGVTAEQRDAALRLRRTGAQLRRRW